MSLIVDFETCKFHLTSKQVNQSVVFSDLIDGSKNEEVLVVPIKKSHITVETMQRITSFLSHHADKPFVPVSKPIHTSEMRDLVGAWDANFITLDQKTLLEMLMAANYLNIPTLLNLVQCKIASLLRCKSLTEIKKIF